MLAVPWNNWGMDDASLGTPPVQQEPLNTPIPAETPQPQPSSQDYQPYQPPVYKPKPSFGFLPTIILFAALFAVGYWASGWIRDYISLPIGGTKAPAPTAAALPTPPSIGIVPISTGSALTTGPFADWKTYSVLTGATRQAIAGMGYKLPPSVLAPVCDGTDCRSQGTYLPGGTRFTVAPRGKGQVLPDFRGKVVSDIAGRAFVVRNATVGTRQATEFTGSFSGETVSRYPFTQMRGFMIVLSDDLSLEINHFAPTGVKTDFAADEVVFEDILKTLEFPAGLTVTAEKGIAPLAPTAAVTAAASPTPIATLAPTATPTMPAATATPTIAPIR